ncbi:sortase [Bifidobacterium margollesii]|uniref:Sortase n=1 Tax=Bifidobacterium margollesii TaxID=2020964 RepID=A0A2N5J7H9_9BIFI|nr:sortase [Bifidobacterium margollesii]PLS30165.1 sortase [Bifidobacterium margollesii]
MTAVLAARIGETAREGGLPFPSWEQIVSPGPAGRPRGAARRRLTVLGVTLTVLGALILTLPVTIGLASLPRTMPHTATARTAEDTQTLARAAAYDRGLLAHGTIAVGEAADPFGGSDQPAYETDRDYQSQLGAGGMMAAIRIPRVGVNLAVGHGTGPGTLETGAGHVYGTTLPVGDPGNTVIAAHRGLGARLLFYRLGELAPGDMVYTEAAGRTVAWRVDRIERVDPGSAAERAILTGSAKSTRLTLYTCDPPGLNTRRLIVAARRVPYVDATSVPGQSDPWTPWAAGGLTGLTALTAALIAAPREQVMRHARRR